MGHQNVLEFTRQFKSLLNKVKNEKQPIEGQLGDLLNRCQQCLKQLGQGVKDGQLGELDHLELVNEIGMILRENLDVDISNIPDELAKLTSEFLKKSG